MSLREQFEKLFSVPHWCAWVESRQQYFRIDDEDDPDPVPTRELNVYRNLWKGFQAGHAAGLEDACTVMRANFTRDMADEMQAAIRAMRGEVK